MKNKFCAFLIKKYKIDNLTPDMMNEKDRKNLLDMHRSLKASKLQKYSRKHRKLLKATKVFEFAKNPLSHKSKRDGFMITPKPKINVYTKCRNKVIQKMKKEESFNKSNPQVYRPNEPVGPVVRTFEKKNTRNSTNLKVYPAGHVFEDNNHGTWTGKGFKC